MNTYATSEHYSLFGKEMGLVSLSDCLIYTPMHIYYSLLDNATNFVVGCIIQKRTIGLGLSDDGYDDISSPIRPYTWKFDVGMNSLRLYTQPKHTWTSSL